MNGKCGLKSELAREQDCLFYPRQSQWGRRGGCVCEWGGGGWRRGSGLKGGHNCERINKERKFISISRFERCCMNTMTT